jgi:hypothetical protein
MVFIGVPKDRFARSKQSGRNWFALSCFNNFTVYFYLDE